MSDFHRFTNGDGQPDIGRSSGDSFARLVRFVGRLVLWGCVLLLLVRGAISVLGSGSRVAQRARVVTVPVMQPAHSGTSQEQRK